MDIEAGLYAYLQSKTLLTALISDRLYPEEASQGVVFPYITYEEVDTQRTTHLRGASAYADTQFTFTIHAETPESRDTVKEAMRNILHTRRNVELTGSIDMRVAILEASPNSYVSNADGSETGGDFQCEMDFRIIFFETAPTLP